MRNIYDQLGKLSLQAALRPVGPGQPGQEVVAEVQQIDFWFAGPEHPERLTELGLLGQLATKATVFELYSEAPGLEEMRECTARQHVWYLQQRRQAEPGTEIEFPQMWLLCAGRPRTVLGRYRCRVDAELGAGVYRMPGPAYEAGLVVLSELDETPDTLLLRLLGRGQHQRRAIRELLAQTGDNRLRQALLEILGLLRFEVEQEPGDKTDEEEEFLMTVQQTFQEWEQEVKAKTLERSGQQAVLRVYEARFHDVPVAVRERVEAEHDLEVLDRWLSLVATATAEQIATKLLDSPETAD